MTFRIAPLSDDDKNAAQPIDLSLHKSAAEDNVDQLEKTIRQLGDKAPLLAKKYAYSDLPALPIELMKQNRYFYKNQQRFRDLLEPITLDCKILPLNALLDEKEIPKKYPEKEYSSRLIQNLTTAYQVINTVRNQIKISETHPSFNTLSQKEKEDISAQMNLMRTSRKIEFTLGQKEENPKTEFAIVKEYAAKYEAANCAEFSYLALDEYSKLNNGINAEVFRYSNGDHVFLVIDRDPLSDPGNYKTWGKNAVILDAWGGYAIPAEHAASEEGLKCYFDYELTNMNVVLPFDPDYHQLQVKDVLAFEEEPESPISPRITDSPETQIRGTDSPETPLCESDSLTESLQNKSITTSVLRRLSFINNDNSSEEQHELSQESESDFRIFGLGF